MPASSEAAFARLKANLFRGTAVLLTEAQLDGVGALVGVKARELRAIIAVESAGTGYYANGQLKMLFEPHRFYALLPAGPKRDKAVAAGLAYPKWGTKPYPKDSYPRLIQAMVIDETAALKSCSWGLTQIMGSNHAACGYVTVQDMVTAFCGGEAAHMAATVALLKSWGLDDELRAHNWPAIAKGWNGPQYAKNAYDKKLDAAYKADKKLVRAAQKAGATVAPLPVAKTPVRAANENKAPAGLPAVAPRTLADVISGFFAGLRAA